MSKIALNDTVSIDLSTLIDTRLLVQANSGGGKSWLLRRLLEQSHGKVQQIVIDLEGEFSTLREKYDYLLAAKEGDTSADPRSASLLAKRLLELNVSAIIDLYELSSQDRKHFVRLFLSAMVNAPKALWHPCLVVIDESHVFCPQVGQSEAMEAVINLATRGRKRGYCVLLATQRLSKLHKDAVAEMNNKLIGRTGLDIDRKRAAEELGFTIRDDALSLRNLAPGEFYAFGPALSDTVQKVSIGLVETSHPKAGGRIVTRVTPPTKKIREIVAKLVDLPQEAQQEAQDVESLKAENINLRRRITQLEKQRPRVTEQKIVTVEKSNPRHIAALQSIRTIVSRELGMADPVVEPVNISSASAQKPVVGGALRMLQVLVSRYPMAFTKSQLALLSNLSSKSGTYGTYLSLLKSQGFIKIGAEISITQTGIDYVGGDKPKPKTQEEVLDMWRSNLTGGARRMLDVLAAVYPKELCKADLGERTGMSYKSGTFGTYLSTLRRNGLIEVRKDCVRANANLFMAQAGK